MDSFPSGLLQPPGSMRFALDSLLLPSFVRSSLLRRPLAAKNPRRDTAFALTTENVMAAADLGCGCGASTIALAKLVPDVKILGVDLADELVQSAAANARRFGCGDRCVFTTKRVEELGRGSAPCCDFVLTNPPYWEEGNGRESQSVLNEQARRGKDALQVFLACARDQCVHRGRLFVVYPAARLVPLVRAVEENGFGVRALLFVRAKADRPAARVLLDAQRGAASDVTVLADLVLYEESGDGSRVPSARALAFCPWLH